jgi:hypothetical protein
MAGYWLINVLACRKKGSFTMLSDIVYTENMICYVYDDIMELFSLGVKLETTMLWISSVGISTWKRTCMFCSVKWSPGEGKHISVIIIKSTAGAEDAYRCLNDSGFHVLFFESQWWGNI